MQLGAELKGDWIRDCIVHLRENNFAAIEPAPRVDVGWAREVEATASETQFPKTDSWYTGANIEGKHREFAVHMGAPAYFEKLTQIAQAGYPGLVLEQAASELASTG